MKLTFKDKQDRVKAFKGKVLGLMEEHDISIVSVELQGKPILILEPGFQAYDVKTAEMSDFELRHWDVKEAEDGTSIIEEA